MERPGTVLAGKYRLQKIIGKGGFASVWEANNQLIDRRVAIKLLSPRVAQIPGVVRRFIREAKLAARELHPTIVRVEDMGQTDMGAPFLVMEFLDGQSLDQLFKQKGSLPLPQCLAITRPVLEGLTAAHAKGIIHRDVKPGNIFLVKTTTSGSPVRILDMGIAKDLENSGPITRTGQLIGTPRYLAPEILLDPCPENWRPTVDVFALGVVIYKMLTGLWPLEYAVSSTDPGRVLKQIETYEHLLKHDEEIPGPMTLNSNVPKPIDTFVQRALTIKWEERYSDAKEMLRAFDAAMDDMGIPITEIMSWTSTIEPDGSLPADQSEVTFEESKSEFNARQEYRKANAPTIKMSAPLFSEMGFSELPGARDEKDSAELTLPIEGSAGKRKVPVTLTIAPQQQTTTEEAAGAHTPVESSPTQEPITTQKTGVPVESSPTHEAQPHKGSFARTLTWVILFILAFCLGLGLIWWLTRSQRSDEEASRSAGVQPDVSTPSGDADNLDENYSGLSKQQTWSSTSRVPADRDKGYLSVFAAQSSKVYFDSKLLGSSLSQGERWLSADTCSSSSAPIKPMWYGSNKEEDDPRIDLQEGDDASNE